MNIPLKETPQAQHGSSSSILTWAKANSGDRAATRARILPPGQHEGTLRHPFPVVDRERYLASIKGMGIPKRAETAPKESVQLSDLRGIQRTVNAEKLSRYMGNPDLVKQGARASGSGMPIDLPVVVKKDGQTYLHDGHHRATAAYLRGAKSIRARVVDLDKGE